jgi:hypothetical protein
MVRHQAIGIEAKAKPGLIAGEALKIELAVRVVPEDVALLVAARDDVVHGAGELQPGRS